MKSRPRTKPAAERREDLMNAAEKLFLEQGFEQTTVEDITIAADVAKGTFYLQFASKTEILDALRQRFVRTMSATIAAAVEACKPGDFEGRLAGWARSCAIHYLQSGPLHHLVFVIAPPPNREGLTRNVLIDSLEELLAGGAESGAWSVDDPHLTAVFLFNALHGAVNQPGNEVQENREKLLAAIITHFFRSVGVDG